MLLEIKNLKTHYRIKDGMVKAVDGVSLSVKEDEVFGLAGPDIDAELLLRKIHADPDAYAARTRQRQS